MGKMFRKNQVIITALAVMIAVAGYLNFSGKELSEYGIDSKKDEVALDISDADEETESDEVQEEETSKEEVAESDENTESLTVMDTGEVVSNETADSENPGAAVLVSSMDANFFSSAKLNREQTRAQNKETLMEIVENESLTDKEKKKAVNQVVKLTKAAEQETEIETVLEAKGFSNIIVSIADNSAEVIVGGNELTEQQIAQIEDVIKRKAEIASGDIVITPVGINEEN